MEDALHLPGKPRLLTLDDQLPLLTFAWRSYNVFMAAPAPSNVEASKPSTEDKHRHQHTAYAAEASGLLVIAILLLILVLIRYWPYISWSAR